MTIRIASGSTTGSKSPGLLQFNCGTFHAASHAIKIDLVSDTATKPTPDMRRAMAEAPVGDEQRGEDPTVNALNERVADLLGQEAAMFLPSGTICNQVAIATHCRADGGLNPE